MAPFGHFIGMLLVGTLSTTAAVEQAGRAPFDAPGAPHANDDLREIPGVLEFSGTMILRPIDAEKAQARGVDMRELHARAEAAIDMVSDLEIFEYIPATDEYIVALPAGESENGFRRRFLQSGNFEYVQPDWRVFALGCPNDPGFGTQWHHAKVGSCTAWNYSTGSSAITVAVCDTGVRTSHVDLSGLNREGYNSIYGNWESGGAFITDENGHGTSVAGVAAARGNNSTGVSGMGWSLSFRPVRVTNGNASFTSLSTILNGARAACDAGDKVISVSFTGVSDPAVESTGAYLRSKGSLLVWAAGNAGESLAGVRADNVIVVGATDANDNRVVTSLWSSNYGPRIDFVAPGLDLYTTAMGSNTSYAYASGTSFATPMVSGLCGLIWSRNPSLTPAQVESILRASATDLGAAGPDDVFGYGRINAGAALAMVKQATRTTLWATSVPDNSSWTNESYAAGAETCDNCNTSTCQYSTNANSGNTTALAANDLQSFTLASGQKIVKVEVEVSGRYDTGTSASLAIRALAPSYGIDSGWRNSPTFVSGERCAPRAGSVGDITSLTSSWTAAKINNLQLQVRRQTGLSGNNLRIVSMKILVTTEPI